MIATQHMRHIFMPIDQTVKKLFISHNNLLNVTIQSIQSKGIVARQMRSV